MLRVAARNLGFQYKYGIRVFLPEIYIFSYLSFLLMLLSRLQVRRLLCSARPVAIQTSVSPSASDQDMQQVHFMVIVPLCFRFGCYYESYNYV